MDFADPHEVALCRLLVISRLTRLHGILEAASRQDVIVFVWPEAESHGQSSLPRTILATVRKLVDGRRVESVAIVAPTTQTSNVPSIDLDVNTKVS